MDDEYDVDLEENSTLSMQIKYIPETLTFKTSFICGHLWRDQKKNILEYQLPRKRINYKMEDLEKRNMHFSLFDFVSFEGSSLDIYYTAFSNKTEGKKMLADVDRFYKMQAFDS